MSATGTRRENCGSCNWELLRVTRNIVCGACGKHFHKDGVTDWKCGNYFLTCFEFHCFARGAVYKDCKDKEKALNRLTFKDVKPTKTFASYYTLNKRSLRPSEEKD